MRQILIYALFDPREPGRIRYVGKAKDISERMKGHIYLAKVKPTNQRLCWIKSLLVAGVFPQTVILEQVPGDTPWQAREQFWIAMFRAAGHALTNTTDGGDGGASSRGKKRPPRSPEHCAKIAAWHKGRRASAETRAKMSAARKGKKHSPEHIAHRAAALRGKTRSAASRLRMSLSRRAYVEKQIAAIQG